MTSQPTDTKAHTDDDEAKVPMKILLLIDNMIHTDDLLRSKKD